uniref:Porin family protein n=1 Tax=Prevotella sp. GTC17254 TaxID=3236794 RepID=A0AB33IZ34_9BACT
MNLANVTKSGGDIRVGLVAGGEFEYQATDMVSLSAGVLYSMQGAKGTEVVEGVNVGATLKLDYINVPIMANVHVAKGFAVKLGVQSAFNVNSSVKAKAAGVMISQDLDVVKSFDFSIPVSLSYEYNNFVVDARYNWGLTEVVKESSAKNSVFQVALGYKFGL